MGQRPEPQRPVVAQLLPYGHREVRGLKVSSLCFGSLEACRAVVGGVQAVACSLDRPDREAIGCSSGAGDGLCGEGHVALVGSWTHQLEVAGWRTLRTLRSRSRLTAITAYTVSMVVVKVRRVGKSNVISIPREFEALGYAPGSSVVVEELPGGELRIMSTESVRERIHDVGERVVADHGEALQILADHDPDVDASRC